MSKKGGQKSTHFSKKQLKTIGGDPKKNVPTRICYYMNRYPDENGQRDNRVWIVSISKTAWRAMRQRYLARGIALKRVPQSVISSLGPWKPMVVDNQVNVRTPESYTV